MGNPQPNQAMSDPKSKRKAPAFQLYVDDFLAGTSDMSAEEVGGYIRLLCHQWTKGGIPDDEDRAGRMAGLLGSPSLRYVLAKFGKDPIDGLLKNARLEKIRADREAYLAAQRESGKKGAIHRWGNEKGGSEHDGDPIGKPMATPLATPMANGWQNDGSPSPSPSPSKELPKSLGLSESMGTKVPRPRFVKPTLDQLMAEADKRGVDQIEAEKFLDYYESNGWKINRAPMVNWTAAFANWARRTKERPQSYQPTLIGTSTPSDAPF